MLEEKQKIIEKEPLEDETLEVFLKESEEIRAEPEVCIVLPRIEERAQHSHTICNCKTLVREKNSSCCSTKQVGRLVGFIFGSDKQFCPIKETTS